MPTKNKSKKVTIALVLTGVLIALGIAAFLIWWFIYRKKDTSPQLETFDSESASQDRIRFINNDWCDYQGFNRAIKVCNNRVTCIRDLCDSGKYDGADGINACRPVYSHICDPHSEPKPRNNARYMHTGKTIGTRTEPRMTKNIQTCTRNLGLHVVVKHLVFLVLMPGDYLPLMVKVQERCVLWNE